MTHRSLIVFIGCILMGISAASAQVRVVVHDMDDQPLAYVNTVLLNYSGRVTNIGASSDVDGLVNYEYIVPGEYHLVIQYLGYVPDTVRNILITGTGKPIDLGIRNLRTEDYILDIVDIIAKAPVITRDANQLTFNIEKTTLATGETALSLLSNVPGVIVNSQNDIVVNGKDNVLVMIDGHQQYVNGAELTNLLLSLSSESIKQVEVRSSASAKYDASGSGAVINIVSKRSSYTGINGSVWARYRQGRYPSGYIGNNLNWKYKKFSGNIYYYFSYYQGYHDIDIKRAVDGLGPGDSPLYFKETLDEMWTLVSHAPRLKLFYSINENHQLGLQAELSHQNVEFPKETETQISDDEKVADSTVFSKINANDITDLPSVNFSYHGVIGGGTGSVDLAYDFFYNGYDLTSDFQNLLTDANMDPIGSPSVFREISSLTNFVHTAAFDFSKELQHENYLDVGLKMTSIDKVTNTMFETKTGDVYIEDPGRTRSFEYREYIYAGYANWAKNLPKLWTIELGLRVEHTRIRQSAVNPLSSDMQNYTGYFPFAGLFKETENGSTFSLNYARRTLRPSFDQLNPFVLVLNPFLVVSGDPDLVPQINNMIDLEFSFKKNYSVYAGYNLANNSINSVFLDIDDGIYKLTYKNFDRSHFFNAGFSTIVDVNDWWSLTGDFNLAYDFYNVTLEDEKIERSGASVTINLTNQFELPKDFYIDLTGIYESPRYTSIEYYKSTGRVDLTLTKYFLDKDLSLKLRGRDLFYTSKFESSLNYLDLHSDYLERSGSRRIELTITYKYSRGENFKSKRNRSSNTEEKGRT